MHLGSKLLFTTTTATLALALTHCGGRSAEAPVSIPSPTAAPSETHRPPTEETTMAPEANETTPDLDLRYANVTGVTMEPLGGNEYRFSVTLQHDDEGEAPNFANAWQVEDLEGNVLGRRELLHSHGNQPFTRSTTIVIPEEVDTVIVRGHDMTHGFGGQVMEVDLRSGEASILPSSQAQ